MNQSAYSNIDEAKTGYDEHISRIGTDTEYHLSVSQEAYDSVTGPLDVLFVWANVPVGVDTWSWQVVCYFQGIVDILSVVNDPADVKILAAAQAFLTAANSNVGTEYDASLPAIVLGTVEESIEDIGEIADNTKKAIETVTQPPILLGAFLLALLLAFR